MNFIRSKCGTQELYYIPSSAQVLRLTARYCNDLSCSYTVSYHANVMRYYKLNRKLSCSVIDSYNQYGMDVPTDAEIERKQISHMSSELAAALADLVIFCKDKMLTCIQHSNEFVQITRHVFQR